MRIVVKIPHVVWRDGRPRFVPGPRLRQLGFRGEDLRDAHGDWLGLEATRRWAEARAGEIAGRKRAPSPASRAKGRETTIEDMFEALWKLRRSQPGQPGALSRATVADYQGKARALQNFDPELYVSPAAAVTRSIVLGLHERLWEEKGLAMANGVIAVLRLAYTSFTDRHPGKGLVNPCLRLRLPSPRPRVRVASPAEIAALVRAADAEEPALGDAIMLAVLTGQRQGDVLAAKELDLERARFALAQAKTGARVSVRILAALRARITAAKARRIAAGRLPGTFVLNPAGRPYQADVFRHRFAAVRARAAEAEPTLRDFWFMDLRDTAITWLANSGCTHLEIASISGHSVAGVASILKHYHAGNEIQADAATDKLEAWLAGQGVTL